MPDLAIARQTSSGGRNAGQRISAARPWMCMEFFEPPTIWFSLAERYPLVMWTGLLPNASRTSSRPFANRARLRTTSADGVLSISARAATSEAVSSSREKCAESIISTSHFSEFFGVHQGRIEGFAGVILVRLSRDADDFGKSPAELFDGMPATVGMRFHKRHSEVHDFESQIDVHFVCSSSRMRTARSVRF